MQDAEEKRLAEQRLRVLERDREEEARRLTAKLNRVAEERMKREVEAASKPDTAEPPSQPPQKYGVASEPESVAEPSPPPAIASTRSLGHVTILLVMEPGTNGIRRYGKKTADPVICAGPTCWAGAGPDHPATEMPRGKALGPGNTLGRRAAACNQKLACVFRDVDLGSNPQALQPIDLRVMRHDRREPLTVAASGRCEVAGSQLYCADTLKSRTWRAWIIPEDVAERAGPAALTGAVEGGLSSARAADLRSSLQQ
jgi:colicin import membrane protein